MAETVDTANEIKTIRYRIESIETTQHLLLRAQSKELMDELLALFTADENLAQVYLALDEPRNQSQIIARLKGDGSAISQPTVSRKLAKLDDEGLIEPVGAGMGGTEWGKKKVVEKVLRLTRRLNKQLKAQAKS